MALKSAPRVGSNNAEDSPRCTNQSRCNLTSSDQSLCTPCNQKSNLKYNLLCAPRSKNALPYPRETRRKEDLILDQSFMDSQAYEPTFEPFRTPQTKTSQAQLYWMYRPFEY